MNISFNNFISFNAAYNFISNRFSEFNLKQRVGIVALAILGTASIYYFSCYRFRAQKHNQEEEGLERKEIKEEKDEAVSVDKSLKEKDNKEIDETLLSNESKEKKIDDLLSIEKSLSDDKTLAQVEQKKVTPEIENVAQEAYQTFLKNKKLKLHVNRSHSKVSFKDFWGKVDKDVVVCLDKNIIEHFVSNATEHKSPTHQYYFTNLTGKTCYINEEGVDRFTEIAKKHFPSLGFFKRGGVVDKKTGIELFAISKNGPFSFTSTADVDFAMKVSAWVVKLDTDE